MDNKENKEDRLYHIKLPLSKEGWIEATFYAPTEEQALEQAMATHFVKEDGVEAVKGENVWTVDKHRIEDIEIIDMDA